MTQSQVMYELVPPDGGWGYAVTFALSIMMTSTIVPISSFALIFGNYLSTFTDETYATAIVSSLFGTVLHITGLLSHFVLKKFSYRQVGIIGSFLYFTGSFGVVFATDLHHVVLTYSIIQGIGVGLIMPSALSAVNSYFDKKKAVMHSVAQAFLTCVNIFFPLFTRILLDEYGFRGTQAIFAAISLHAFLGAILLRPVSKHMKKVEKITAKDFSYDDVSNISSREVSYRPAEGEQLLYKVVDLKESGVSSLQPNKLSKSLTSVTSFGSMVFAIGTKKKNDRGCLFSICEILDMDLLKDVFYLNMAFGLAICTMSEMNFMAILPLFLFDNGFSKRDVTVVMTVYFASDLVMRVMFVIVAAFFQFSCRKVFLCNAILTFLIRLVFSVNDSFWWITTSTAILGLSRCLIQTPMPVVIAEVYSEKFSSALSFYMVVTGVTSIALGAVMGLGTGLLLPSALSAINEYFDKKKTLTMAIGQTIMALINIVYPGFTRILLENYGFRGTQSIFTAMSLHIILGALLLQPVKWHLKRRLIDDAEISLSESSNINTENSSKYSPVPSEIEGQQLLEDKALIISPDQNKLSKSLTSLASATSYLTRIQNEEKSSKKSSMDLSILKDGCYWNLIVGLAISAISETNFMAVLPITFFNMDFTKNEVTLMMTIYFTSDLVTRIIFSLITAFFVFSMQQLFLINILLTIILRIVFVANHSFWFMVVLTALMGSSRCLIQVPVPMVIAEIYPKKFTSAYSLYMVVNGVLSVIIGALIGMMKHQTGSHAVVLHSLTAIFFLCAIPWTVQMIHNYWKTKKTFLR